MTVQDTEGLDAKALKLCPFCGLEPESNMYFVWCTGPEDEPHGLVQLAYDRWNCRDSVAPDASALRTAAEAAQAVIKDLLQEQRLPPSLLSQKAQERLCNCGAAGTREGHSDDCPWETSEWAKWTGAVSKFVPCGGCDGYNCDEGCAYPGAIPARDITRPEQTSIPIGVYYSREHGNFYSIEGHHGQGIAFWNRWRDRCMEFPGDPRIASLPAITPQSSEVGELVERLRRHARTMDNHFGPPETMPIPMGWELEEAADALTRQASEIERLRKALDASRSKAIEEAAMVAERHTSIAKTVAPAIARCIRSLNAGGGNG